MHTEVNVHIMVLHSLRVFYLMDSLNVLGMEHVLIFELVFTSYDIHILYFFVFILLFVLGEIEDYPGMDKIPSYQVTTSELGQITVYPSNYGVYSVERPLVDLKETTQKFIILGGGGSNQFIKFGLHLVILELFYYYRCQCFSCCTNFKGEWI